MANPFDRFDQPAPRMSVRQPAQGGNPFDQFDPPGDERDNVLGKVDATVRGAADSLSFGLADELAAAVSTGSAFGLNKGLWGDYDKALAAERAIDKSDSDNRFGYRLAGQLLGGLGGAAGLVRLGASFAANSARAGHGLGRVAAGGAADGAILGALHGAGSGEGAEGRAKGAVGGAAGGGIIGGAAPFAVAGVSAAARPFIAPIMSRLRPEAYANRTVGEGMRRAGMTPQDVARNLAQARADGQDVFNVADALGHSGQRMMSTVVRNPHDMRQQVVDALVNRQMGQSDRLSRTLAEGFAAPDTAAQRTARLRAQRRADADVNYAAARGSAVSVDPSAAIRAADDFLTPGAMRLMNPGSNIADDSIESAVRRARAYLTDGRSVLTDFNAALRSKREMDRMIETAPATTQRELVPIRNALDEALAAASPEYANARDVFRRQSQAIDAVGEGAAAPSGRNRAADTVQAFRAMTPEQQAAFRAGYADPLIAKVESAAMAPTTNRARPLTSAKFAAEFPVVAAPGQGPQMMRRIGREQRMFETSNAALGGSRTADNLADAAELSKVDPGVMSNLLRGRPISAMVDAVTRALSNEMRGTSPRVIEQMAQILIETDPRAAMQLLTPGAQNAGRAALQRAMTATMLTNLGAAGTGRLAAP